jgi:hypothetical protein
MKYRRLELHCECGRHTTRIREVGITTKGELLLYWRCQDCKKHVYAVLSLSECSPDQAIEAELGSEPASLPNPADRFQETDEIILHALGVKLPESAS